MQRVRTFSPKPTDIQRAWHVVDADGLVLGRMATEVARVLRGKHKPTYAPHMDTGDHVVVVNAAKVVQWEEDPQLREFVRDSDVISADGQAVVWAARLLGRPLPGRAMPAFSAERLR